MKTALLFLVLVRILVIACITWVCLSFVASVVRNKEGHCGERYSLDRYIAADLFCPIKETK